MALGSGSSHIFGVPLEYFCNGGAVLLALAELLVFIEHARNGHVSLPL